MIQLHPDAYAPVHRFLGVSPFTGECRSVTSGHSPGWVFVDDDSEPSVALIGSIGMEGFWLFSDPTRSDLSPLVRDFAEVQGRAVMDGVGYGFLEVSSAEDACEAAIHDALSPRGVEVSPCWILKSEPGQTCAPSSLPVVPLAEALRSNLDGGLDLARKISLFWEGLEGYDGAEAMGFCTVVDGILKRAA